MIKYKIDVVAELKESGYSTYRIRKENLIAESVMTKLRTGNTAIDTDTINNICKLLDCQPGNILKYVPDEEIKTK